VISWSSGLRRSQITIFGEHGTLLLDDKVEPKVSLSPTQGAHRFLPYAADPPLYCEMKTFLQMIEEGRDGSAEARRGFEIARAIDAVERSLRRDGLSIPI
jgi:predicted dehydrogenase